MPDMKKNDPRRSPSSREEEEARRRSGQPGAQPQGPESPRQKREGERMDEDVDSAQRDQGRQSGSGEALEAESDSRTGSQSDDLKPFSRRPESHSSMPLDGSTQGGAQPNRDQGLGGEASVKSSSEAPGREIIDERRRARVTGPRGKI